MTNQLNAIWRDAVYAVRTLLRVPGFTATIVVTLALCIGANAVIFSVVDAVLFRPVPYGAPSRLAQVVTRFNRPGGPSGINDSHDGREWFALRNAKSFELAGWAGGTSEVNLAAAGQAMSVKQQRVTANYFHVLDVPMALGRDFNGDEDHDGGPAAAILSYDLWRNVFSSDAGLLGKTVMLRGEPHQVVGVAGQQFRSLYGEADVWTPMRPNTTGEGGGDNYGVLARLNAGATWEQARAEAAQYTSAALAHPEFAQLDLMPLQDVSSIGLSRRLWILWTAVGFVLLIGCANVAGLLLARGAARVREMGTRIALGGGRAALLRQLGIESLLLATLGGAAGLGLAYAGIHAIQSVAAEYGIWQEVRLDLRVALAMFAASLATSLIFGLAPALQALRVDVRTALTASGSRAVTGGASHRVRRVLVTAEIALGLVLLISAGLLVRTLWGLEHLEPGFDGRNTISASVSLQDARYRTSAQVNGLYNETLAEIRATPGVERAAVALHIPYERWLNAGVRILPRDGRESTTVNYVTDDYFETLKMPVIAGRTIDGRDLPKSTPVAVVNRAFAQRLMRGQPAVGGHLRLFLDGSEREVVGVVGDLRTRSEGQPLTIPPAVYLPVSQLPDQVFGLVHTWFSPDWIVRGNIAATAPAIRRALQHADATLPVTGFVPLETERGRALGLQRMQSWMLGAMALLALVLAAVGIHGLIAHSVAERSRELGIRMALGATLQHIVARAALPGLALAAIGIVIGTVAAAAGTRLMANLLFEVKPLDPLTFAAVPAILLTVAAAASLLPALRLTRIDPADVLRQD